MTRLRQRMIEDMEIRNLSSNTQLSYLQQVSGFAKYCHRSPELVGPEEIRAYQLHLTSERKLAPGTLCIVASKSGGTPESASQPSRPLTVRLNIDRAKPAVSATVRPAVRSSPQGPAVTTSARRCRVASTRSRTGSAGGAIT